MMLYRLVVYFLLIVTGLMYSHTSTAQTDDLSFKSAQYSSPRVAGAMARYHDTISTIFAKKNIDYRNCEIYIRAFKSQNDLELWARNIDNNEYKHIKTYRICALSGKLGPKRAQGDRQVPEGLYFIDEFNPKSDYYLSLLLNYPNYSDSANGGVKLGGDIYIHGGCVTIGCLPMTNDGIQELYAICLNARLSGEEYIPVHIYPTRLNRNGMNYLTREFPNDLPRQQLWAELKTNFDYFEKYHKLLPVMYTPEGRYTN